MSPKRKKRGAIQNISKRFTSKRKRKRLLLKETEVAVDTARVQHRSNTLPLLLGIGVWRVMWTKLGHRTSSHLGAWALSLGRREIGIAVCLDYHRHPLMFRTFRT